MASDLMGVKRTHEGPTGPVSYYSLRALAEQRGIAVRSLGRPRAPRTPSRTGESTGPLGRDVR